MTDHPAPCPHDPSMTCKDLIEFICDYLDGELESGTLSTFEAHLHACPPCMDYFESYRETVRLSKEALALSERASDDDSEPTARPTPCERAAELPPVPRELADAIKKACAEAARRKK